MSGRHKFSDLVERLSPEARERVDDMKREIEEHIEAHRNNTLRRLILIALFDAVGPGVGVDEYDCLLELGGTLPDLATPIFDQVQWDHLSLRYYLDIDEFQHLWYHYDLGDDIDLGG